LKTDTELGGLSLELAFERTLTFEFSKFLVPIEFTRLDIDCPELGLDLAVTVGLFSLYDDCELEEADDIELNRFWLLLLVSGAI
jgi:hypothetical protein